MRCCCSGGSVPGGAYAQPGTCHRAGGVRTRPRRHPSGRAATFSPQALWSAAVLGRFSPAQLAADTLPSPPSPSSSHGVGSERQTRAVERSVAAMSTFLVVIMDSMVRRAPQASFHRGHNRTATLYPACFTWPRANCVPGEPFGRLSRKTSAAAAGSALDSGPNGRQDAKTRSRCTLHHANARRSTRRLRP